MNQRVIMTTPEMLSRPSCPALDHILGASFPLLEKGFVRVVDYMGNEAAIVQAARVSYGAGTKTASTDEGLIRYLLRHRHTTPFEMCSIKLHIKLPIFVARQWIRHRTAKVNEYSARYSIMAREFYIPQIADMAKQSTQNRQGRDEGLDSLVAENMATDMARASNQAFDLYEDLADEDGPNLSRELARIVLPLNTYTEWYWKVDLHNLLHFLSLRADPHAQKEIRVYAEKMLDILGIWMPTVLKAFKDYRMDAHTFSGPEMAVLRDWLAMKTDMILPPVGENSNRENEAFWKALGMEQSE